MSERYALHGLALESDVPIDASPLREGAPVELRVVQGRGPRPEFHGDVVCAFELPGPGRCYGLDLRDGYGLTFGAYSFRVTRALDRAEWWAPGETPAAVGHMVSGTLMTFVLQLMEVAVVHASVVRAGSTTLVFAGQSGAGKSTLAALFCESGAALLTDDVLRLDVADEGVVGHPGGTALRLRPASEPVGARFAGTRRFRAQDGRLGVRPEVVTTPLALDHVLLPAIRTEHECLEVRRLSPRDALVGMLAVPRWVGWRIPGPPRAQFQVMSAVAESVPVSELRLPVDDELSLDLVTEILESLS